IKEQRENGNWPAHRYGDKIENQRRTAMLTAYVARVLATSAPKNETRTSAKGTNTSAQKPDESLPALKRALEYLSPRIQEFDEPYLIASYALAALEVNDAVRA